MSKRKELLQDEFGNRMKEYERKSSKKIEPKDHVIIRIDGKKFSKFTKGFKKPFDDILSKCMVNTTKALVEEFGAVIGYTQSDEISLVIPKTFRRTLIPTTEIDATIAINKETKEDFVIENYFEDDELYPKNYIYINEDEYFEQVKYGMFDKKTGKLPIINSNMDKCFEKYDLFYEKIDNNQLYNGKVQKLVSIIASFATLQFNINLNKFYKSISTEDYNGMPEKYIKERKEYTKMLKDKQFKAIFDARAFGVPSDIEAFNSILWRVRDAKKNSKSMFTQYYLGHKKTLNMNGDEKIEKCLKETGQDWNKLIDGYKYGFFVKKKIFKIKIPKEKLKFNDSKKTAERTKIIVESKDLNYSKEAVKYIMIDKLPS